MSGAPVPVSLRLTIYQRAQARCEYCLLHQQDTIVRHQPDHIVAAQHGGQAVADNLALACCDCNLFKGPNIASVDPTTGQPAFLFHPRRDRWTDHFRLEGGHILGLTAAGRATVFLLHLNLSDRIRLRETLQRTGRYPKRA